MITDWYPAAREELVAGGWTERSVGIFTRLNCVDARHDLCMQEVQIMTRALCERFGILHNESNDAKFVMLLCDLGEVLAGSKGRVEKL